MLWPDTASATARAARISHSDKRDADRPRLENPQIDTYIAPDMHLAMHRERAMSTFQRHRKAALGLAAIIPSLLIVLPAYSADGSSEAADIVVHVRNVAPQGTIRLGLYTEASYPDNDATPVASADLPARAGETVIELRNIPSGTYAIETYQDLNNNGKIDFTLIGIPKEPYGFSRDARPLLSKPRFERVKFSVSAGRNDQTVHLQNVNTLVATQ